MATRSSSASACRVTANRIRRPTRKRRASPWPARTTLPTWRRVDSRAACRLPWQNHAMRIYLVGGAVRDKLLGRDSADRDYVVTGARPQDLLSRGYKAVGKDFPVFLHPATGEEYALARTERKQGHGYHGFVFHAEPSVTLEDDLIRRDLTINAMAEDENGKLIDP